ncbi:GNAT family N-acetyltransferase [Nocardiopsis kunsanensis]|uniref:N-acetyltransferase n=1 Tax=Nocardiopsis kunsanensis TaxID=141693 RepID=A0A919CG12_9ACTN|nr:GNAT family N-acetyltransferase [Nocardiopsis kunsanensis]GHD18949.1 N-acetyltransferase [Nocardiopsis kunsanensis]
MSHAATAPTVRSATAEDVPGIARALGLAFWDDPLYRWLFPDTMTRRARTVRFHALFAGFAYVPDGTVDVVQEQVESPPHPVVRGAAWWDAPGHDAESRPSFLLRSLPHLAGLVGLSRLPAVSRYFARVGEARPNEPHWYLAALGTDPVAQGAGAGSALMRTGLERADADGLPVFLETMNPDNLPFYERHGFRVTKIMDETGTPTAYSMLRPAGS